ncbi:MAG: hypothetical protein ACK5QQ_07380 [Cyanobacteriota bacterium]
MEKFFQEQVERIDRLMKIVEANDPYTLMNGLLFYDIIVFTCQSMWHLKDWILNDPNFRAADYAALKKEIHTTRTLLVCSDIANGSKHLSLNYPKAGSTLFVRTGIHDDPVKGIFKEFYYIYSPDPADEFHGMEIRTFLRYCRNSWEDIINRHYLSQADAWLAQQGA